MPQARAPLPLSVTFAALLLQAPLGGACTQSPEPVDPDADVDLRVEAELDEGPGNLTLRADGSIVLSLHQFFEPAQRVVTLRDGGLEPVELGELDGGPIDAVLGLQRDAEGTLWLLDNGLRGGAAPRLIAAPPDGRARVYPLAEAAPADAFVNDLAVDLGHGAVFIADPAGGANAGLILVDIASGETRRVLEGHGSVIPEALDLLIDGEPVEIANEDGSRTRPHIGVNPIALDGDDAWLYFGPMHGGALYRAKTADLLDAGLSAGELAERVERYADKPICDGISIDDAGNIYLGDLANNAIGVITPDRSYRELVRDARLSWIDAFSAGPDGRMYSVANQLHRTAALHGGEATFVPPFLVLSFVPLAPGEVGR